VLVPGYEILEELGRGGMGVVYKARQVRLKRLVALKMILARGHASDDDRARFRREAEAEASLQHPNIVQVYEINEHEGLDYFALEYLNGGSLAQRLRTETVSPADAAALVAVLARAVHHAHERGIIHRDLKPANVLLQGGPGSPLASCGPKITDFGLAKQLETDSGQTRSGAVLGTPSYMAPEQASGNVHAVGPPADIYALGAILYELCTGRPPFRGTTIRETLDLVCTRDPVPPSHRKKGVPRDLETICLKALAKEPGQRYGTALALAHDLERFRAGEPILGRRQSALARFYRRARRHPRTTAGILAAILLLALVGVYIVHAAAAGRTGRLQSDIAASLARLDPCSADEIVQVRTLIATLDTLDSGAASGWRQRLLQRQQDRLDALLQQPKLEGAEADRVRQGIALIEGANPTEAADLQTRLSRRLSAWRVLVDLPAQQDRLASLFAPGRVERDGTGLRVLGSGRTPLLVPCSTHAEMQAVFALPAGLQSAVGLVLNATDSGGYEFLAEAAKDSKDAPAPSQLRLRIRRHGVTLREEVVPGEKRRSTLHLTVRREHDRLSLELKDGPTLRFRDLFPLTGHGQSFALLCDAGTGVQRLTASLRDAPADPSPLERGDILFEQGKFAEALVEYRQSASLKGGPEARYKEGLCLLELRRPDEALGVFQELGASGAGEWSNLADSRAWLLLRTREDDASQEAADAILDRLSVRGLSAAEMATVLPQDVRDRILQRPLRFESVTDWVFEKPQRLVTRARRVVQTVRLFDSNQSNLLGAEEGLFRALHFIGQEAEALQVADRILAADPDLEVGHDIGRRAFLHRAWILMRSGRAAEALYQTDAWIQRGKLNPPLNCQVRLERARLMASTGRWADAEKEVDTVLALEGTANLVLIEGWLLKGFLCEHRGDAAGAQKAWQSGLAVPEDQLADINLSTFVHRHIMASLTNSISDKDLEAFRGKLASLGGDTSKNATLRNMVASSIPAGAVRGMWRSPRGRREAWRIAWREATFPETFHLPPMLLLAETLREGAFDASITAEQDQLVWDLTRVGHDEVVAGRLPFDQVGIVLVTWKGNTLLWGSIAGRLPSSVRGLVAFVLGHRYRRLNRQAEAEKFFQTARENAGTDSLLYRQVAAELKGKPAPGR
jgi:tetratricopeptide (TPR) repeat protein/tRNA A-37 threonylcarbamoyl transferase component Bud32